jgi:hypothetical protein
MSGELPEVIPDGPLSVFFMEIVKGLVHGAVKIFVKIDVVGGLASHHHLSQA